MSNEGQKPGQSACIPCSLHIRGISATRIILWLVAITIVSFVIGFGILALSGGFPPVSDHTLSPFRQTSPLSSNNITTFSLDNATAGDVELTLGAGGLSLQGGTPENVLMETTVFSKAAEWQPDIVQTTNASRKSVTITDKGHKGKEWFSVDSPNRWEIGLNDNVPVRLDVNVGAGDTTLNLGTLNIETLAVHTGAGDTTVDLAGYHGGRFDAGIKNGIGDITLRIPRESNMRVLVHSHGIGDITNHGLVQSDGSFVTEGFNSSLAVTEIIVNQGIGSISIEAV
ncbi:MAG: toast rack family protein [Methanoregula sp.]|nr:toast rack family protein [Methanoregula sp.]